jgi:hypothetical protein
MPRWAASFGLYARCQIFPQIRTAHDCRSLAVYGGQTIFDPTADRCPANAKKPGNFLHRIATVNFHPPSVDTMASHS